MALPEKGKDLSTVAPEGCSFPLMKIRSAQRKTVERIMETFSEIFSRSRIWKLDSDLKIRIQRIELNSKLNSAEKAEAITREVTEAYLKTFSPNQRLVLENLLSVTREKIVKAHEEKMTREYRSPLGNALRGVYGSADLEAKYPHYNPIKKSIEGVQDLAPRDPRTELTLLHEVVHASESNLVTTTVALILHNLSFFRWPIFSTHKWRQETNPLGAQWEIVNRFSPELRQGLIGLYSEKIKIYPELSDEALRKKMAISMILRDQRELTGGFDLGEKYYESDALGIKEVEKISEKLKLEMDRIEYFENKLNQIFVSSLKNATLSKSAFIREMRKVHGSTLKDERDHDQLPKLLKFPLTIYTAYQVGSLLAAIHLEQEGEVDGRLNRIPLLDIQLMLRFYAWLNNSKNTVFKND